jgi:cysteine desulfurase / selenocysteine lyase
VISGAIGLAEAIRYIQKIGFKAIHEHTHELHQYTLKKLLEIDGITDL